MLKFNFKETIWIWNILTKTKLFDPKEIYEELLKYLFKTVIGKQFVYLFDVNIK